MSRRAPMPGYRWTTCPMWRDTDGRLWAIPDGTPRVEAEALAVIAGWSVVEVNAEVAS